MAKHDAFGRKIGEDTLAEAGWRAPSRSAPLPLPRAADELPSIRVPGAVRRPRRRSELPRPLLGAMLLLCAVTGTALYLGLNALDGALDNSFRSPRVPDVVLPEREDLVRGLDPESFLRPERLAPALHEFQNAGRPLVIRLAPDRVDVQAVGGGHLDALRLDGNGLQRVARSPGHGTLPTFRWSQVDPQAPRRLMEAVERQFALDPNEVDHLLLMAVDGGPRWNAYYRGGLFHFTAALDGSDLKRLPSGPAPGPGTRPRGR